MRVYVALLMVLVACASDPDGTDAPTADETLSRLHVRCTAEVLLMDTEASADILEGLGYEGGGIDELFPLLWDESVRNDMELLEYLDSGEPFAKVMTAVVCTQAGVPAPTPTPEANKRP